MKKIIIVSILITAIIVWAVGCATIQENAGNEVTDKTENVLANTQPQNTNESSQTNKETENQQDTTSNDVITYKSNGVSFEPTQSWKQALEDESIYMSAQPGLAVIMQYIPASAKEALAAEDYEKAIASVKNIAMVIIDSKPLLEGNADAVNSFEKSVKTNNGLLAYYNESFDESGLTEEEITAAKTIFEDFKTNILPQIEKSDIPVSVSSIQEGGHITFTSKDIDGNEANSADIFKDYDITMVNLWASYCPPCVKEMPEIKKYYESKPQNVNVIGILTDVATYDDTSMQAALDIIERTGVTYKSYLVSEDMTSFLMEVNFVPTTIFVDKDGNVIGEPVISALTQSDVERLINERLAMIS